MIDKIEDFDKDLISIDLVKANIVALLMLIPTLLVFGLTYYLIWGLNFNYSDIQNLSLILPPIWVGIIIFLVLPIGTVFHELIHGIVWSLYTRNGFKSIRFGVLWKMLTPYCHCKEPLKVKEYIFGALMPGIVLGLIPLVIAIAMGNLLLLILGIIFTIVASGDFMIVNLLKRENMDDYVQDHPTEAGCFIYRRRLEE